MQFIDYIKNPVNIVNKSACPDDCDFKGEDVPIVGIMPPESPNKLLGIIISRDPTTEFIEVYQKAKTNENSFEWHQLMIEDAPPQWLINKIILFNEKHLNGDYNKEIESLKAIVKDNLYWTHFHKCCTDKNGIKFKHSNGVKCAKKWLWKEILESKALGAKIIICLGKDVESYIKPKEKALPGIRIYYLPHPSGVNTNKSSWYPKTDSELETLKASVIDLLNFCKTEVE